MKVIDFINGTPIPKGSEIKVPDREDISLRKWRQWINSFATSALSKEVNLENISVGQTISCKNNSRYSLGRCTNTYSKDNVLHVTIVEIYSTSWVIIVNTYTPDIKDHRFFVIDATISSNEFPLCAQEAFDG